MYVSESVGPESRGRLPGRWRDRVKEYLCERGATRGGGLDQGRRECLGVKHSQPCPFTALQLNCAVPL